MLEVFVMRKLVAFTSRTSNATNQDDLQPCPIYLFMKLQDRCSILARAVQMRPSACVLISHHGSGPPEFDIGEEKYSEIHAL